MRVSKKLALAVMTLCAEVAAHDLGVSRSEFTERDGGVIHARFTFAERDLAKAMDHDAHVAVDVRVDDTSCTPSAVTSAPDGDGVILDEDFTCARATRSIEVVEYFGTEDVATITTDAGSHQELLNASHRAISVALERGAPPTSRMRSRWPWIAAAACAFALGVAIRSILRRRSS